MKKRFWSVAILLVITFCLTGLSAIYAQKSKAEQLKEMVAAAKITMAEALDKALKSAPGLAVAGKLEKEKGQLIYTFDILPSLTSSSITEVHIDAISGKLLDQTLEKIKAGEEEEETEEKEEKKTEEKEVEKEEAHLSLKDLAAAAKVSLAQALKSAQAASSGQVISAELEKEKGKIIFSFDLLPFPGSQTIHEVHVDAVSGQVIAQEDEKIK
jgi:uncharacterized membrane protein YkoI